MLLKGEYAWQGSSCISLKFSTLHNDIVSGGVPATDTVRTVDRQRTRAVLLRFRHQLHDHGLLRLAPRVVQEVLPASQQAAYWLQQMWASLNGKSEADCSVPPSCQASKEHTDWTRLRGEGQGGSAGWQAEWPVLVKQEGKSKKETRLVPRS